MRKNTDQTKPDIEKIHEVLPDKATDHIFQQNMTIYVRRYQIDFEPL